MKRLSVIIPGYNTRKDWWIRCVRSVVAALDAEDQVICVDDGSREEVREEWFEPCGGGEENSVGVEIKVIRHEKNLGLPSARNTGLDAAADSRYVTFVDSDDEVLPEVYVKTLQAMERTGADVGVFGMNIRYAGEGYQVLDLPPDRYYGALKPEDVRELYRKRLFYYSCNKVFRHAFFKEHGMRFDPLGVPCEDAIFNVGLVMAGATWVAVPFIGYVYYRYDGTICSNYKPTYLEGTRACTKRWREYKATVPKAYEIFGQYDETSDDDLVRGQWTNIWRRNSPYTLRQKWRYANEHRKVLGRFPAWTCLKTAVFMFGRLHFYIKPIRVWHQKRDLLRKGAVIR